MTYFQNFFQSVNERWIQELINAAQDLRNCFPTLAPEQQESVTKRVDALQQKWKVCFKLLNYLSYQAPHCPHVLKILFLMGNYMYLKYTTATN